MRQKLRATKTPADRAQLMENHMKLMQSGMVMLGQMLGGTAGYGRYVWYERHDECTCR